MFILLLCALYVLIPNNNTLAAQCGGDVACQCGDVVTEDYTLSADLGPCPSHGLRLRSGVVLDGNGHRIYADPNAKRPRSGRTGFYARSHKYAAFYQTQLINLKDKRILFQDDFTQFRSQAWEFITGTWHVQNGYMAESSDKNVHNIAVAGPEVEDFELWAQLRSGDDDSIGVTFRFQDSLNFSVVELNAQSQYVRVRQRIAGSFVNLGQVSISPYTRGEMFSIRLRVKQQHLQFAIDDQIVLDKHIKEQSGYGIYLRESTDSTVKNITVTGFYHGIRLREAHRNRIINTEVSRNGNFTAHSGYGIDVAKGSTENYFEGNRINHNADEGIHIGTGGHRTTMVNNEVSDNFRENIYVLRSNHGIFQKNTTRGGKANSVYLKHGAFHRFEQNQFFDRPTRIRGNAHDNQFIDNTFVNAGIHFQAYQEDSGLMRPSKNVVSGGEIRGARYCLRFSDAFDNTVRNTTLSQCQHWIAAEAADQHIENTLIGLNVAPERISTDGRSRFHIERECTTPRPN